MIRSVFVGPSIVAATDYAYLSELGVRAFGPALEVRLHLLDDRDVVIVSNAVGDVEWRFSIGALRAFAETHAERVAKPAPVETPAPEIPL